MTPVAETIVEFYEFAHFFIENYPLFIENLGPPPYKKLQPSYQPL